MIISCPTLLLIGALMSREMQVTGDNEYMVIRRFLQTFIQTVNNNKQVELWGILREVGIASRGHIPIPVPSNASGNET